MSFLIVSYFPHHGPNILFYQYGYYGMFKKNFSTLPVVSVASKFFFDACLLCHIYFVLKVFLKCLMTWLLMIFV